MIIEAREKNFSILHLNIRSCRNNFANLQVFLNSLLFAFTVIVLTETWLSEQIDILFDLDNYTSYSLYRNTHGGGVKISLRMESSLL